MELLQFDLATTPSGSSLTAPAGATLLVIGIARGASSGGWTATWGTQSLTAVPDTLVSLSNETSVQILYLRNPALGEETLSWTPTVSTAGAWWFGGAGLNDPPRDGGNESVTGDNNVSVTVDSASGDIVVYVQIGNGAADGTTGSTTADQTNILVGGKRANWAHEAGASPTQSGGWTRATDWGFVVEAAASFRAASAGSLGPKGII